MDGVTCHLVEGLSTGTAYRYVVRTVTDRQASGWTNIVHVATLPDESSDQPVARFTYNCDNFDTSGFTKHSSGLFGENPWHRDFGDGQTSTAHSPSFTYDEAGSYAVRLLITDMIGRRDEADERIIHCRVRGNRLRCE